MHRRQFLAGTAAIGLLPQLAFAARFDVTRSDAEWRAMLTPLEFKVMRQEGTERAFTSPLDKHWAEGQYHCRGCDLGLYASDTKYDSGTGWPSFYQALPDAVGTKPDRRWFTTYTEAHCRRCGSHLGHIFDDGPKPTGKRHCINGVSLVFKDA
ncbi:peptide-methionine (R)-S-oxide reductase MsrB [Shimia abyssi]|uniref:peptide-methionine (R)-S-oxide reductase n=1 Tax=Shimia abyssi TaxID=1662395 RepID=A0A2P8FJM2_9RHOB|nr:peptide-methionine (R)-S-oxide reductase MsrB [Shimia abyssi]PSL21913.1 peptide-methionine (R)-S-oxide reductase [Shimia abyssi]